MRALLFTLLLLASAPSFAQFAFVASGGEYEVGGGGTSTSTSFTPASADNLLVLTLSIWHATDPTATSVTDTEGGTWTRRLQGVTGSYATGENRVEHWTAPATNTSARSVQVNTNGSSFFRWGFIEVSGAGASPTFQSGSAALAGSATDANVTGVAASADADNFVVGGLAIYEDSNANITTPGDYTRQFVNQDAASLMGWEMIYKINTTAQTESASWGHDSTEGAGDGWAAGLLVIGDGDGDAGGAGGSAATLRRVRSN